MPDRSSSGAFALVFALAGLSACHTSPASLGIAAQPVTRQAASQPSQPLMLTSNATMEVVDARDPKQVAQGVQSVISSQVSGVDVQVDSTGGRLHITPATSGQGRAPLFVIDGVPLADGYGLTILTRVIERIDLFQDSASTKPYGLRAANGVVLIATRAH